jgi:hypothetical protein
VERKKRLETEMMADGGGGGGEDEEGEEVIILNHNVSLQQFKDL